MKPSLFPLSRITAIFAFLLILAFFVSCEKNTTADHTKNSTTDTTKSITGFVDTGSSIVGATMVDAMLNGSITKNSFTQSPPIVLTNKHDMVINGIAALNMVLTNCYNITIKHCQFGPSRVAGITMYSCTNINIDSCYLFELATGVFAADSKTISVTNCQAKNMKGPFPQGQFVQFKNVTGGGNKVSFNKFENILGESSTEDAISMYNCNGLPTDPIVIESNWLRGGGPSLSGGGIMLGDGGGSNMVAKNNILVDPGQYGMAVSGGTYMNIVNNTIYAKAQPFTNNGIYYQNFSGPPSSNIVIAKNAVSFTNSTFALNNTHLGPGDPTPKGWDTNIYVPGLSGNILPASFIAAQVLPPQ
jgi:hypothetical protein